MVATGYKQVGSRATPEAITKELMKLPASAGPLDSRKRALHDLAHALAYVQEQHKVTVVENCKRDSAVGLLIALLTDIDSAPPVPASEDVIRVGRRVLGMGPMDARLYVLSCFVNLSYLGGFLVKLWPTKVALVIILFHCFLFLFPLLRTLKTSSSAIGLTLGKGTSHLPAFSFRFCFTVFERTLLLEACSLSSRYAGTAPFFGSSLDRLLPSDSACIARVFFIWIFSWYRFLAYSLPLIPRAWVGTTENGR